MLTPAGEEIARACETYSVEVQRRLVEQISDQRIDQFTAFLEELFCLLDVAQFSPENDTKAARTGVDKRNQIRGERVGP